jgi:type II secretory ATPase GspE/PulE/Tfp pilus assembly ATPase PilB-like protein
VVGEVRAEECLDLLLALNAGLPGMATLHAKSAREALVRMCTLPVLAGDNNGSLSAFAPMADGLLSSRLEFEWCAQTRSPLAARPAPRAAARRHRWGRGPRHAAPEGGLRP